MFNSLSSMMTAQGVSSRNTSAMRMTVLTSVNDGDLSYCVHIILRLLIMLFIVNIFFGYGCNCSKQGLLFTVLEPP